jgi:hypothetical protein
MAPYGVIGFIIGSIVLVALHRALPPPATPLMLLRLVEGYGIDKSWRRLDDLSPHLIRAAMAGDDARLLPARDRRSEPPRSSWRRKSDVRSDDCPKRGRLPCNTAADKYRNYQKTLNFSDRADSGTRAATAGVTGI